MPRKTLVATFIAANLFCAMLGFVFWSAFSDVMARIIGMLFVGIMFFFCNSALWKISHDKVGK